MTIIVAYTLTKMCYTVSQAKLLSVAEASVLPFCNIYFMWILSCNASLRSIVTYISVAAYHYVSDLVVVYIIKEVQRGELLQSKTFLSTD